MNTEKKEITWRGTENLPVPLLGLATTKELLQELEARLDVEASKGMVEGYFAALKAHNHICRALNDLSEEVLKYRTVDE